MLNPFRKKAEKKPQAAALPKGFKVAAPPSSEQRRLIESDNLTTSGGCRTVHHQPAHR